MYLEKEKENDRGWNIVSITDIISKDENATLKLLGRLNMLVKVFERGSLYHSFAFLMQVVPWLIFLSEMFKNYIWIYQTQINMKRLQSESESHMLSCDLA